MMMIAIEILSTKRSHLPRIILSDQDLPVKKKIEDLPTKEGDLPVEKKDLQEDLPVEKKDLKEDLPVEKKDPQEDLQVEKEDLQEEEEDLPVKKNLPKQFKKGLEGGMMCHQMMFVNSFSQLENAQGTKLNVLRCIQMEKELDSWTVLDSVM